MDIPSSEVTDFILIAASLLYIKTRTLIKDSIEVEEDDEEEISKEELIRRLVEYKKVKKIAIELRKNEEYGLTTHTKLQEDLSRFEIKEEDDLIYDKDILKATLESMIIKNSIDSEFKVDRILNIDEYSLDAYNDKIRNELLDRKILNITDMLKKIKTKSEAIIIFLSVLELSKRKELTINQDVNTHEITIKMSEDIGDE